MRQDTQSFHEILKRKMKESLESPSMQNWESKTDSLSFLDLDTPAWIFSIPQTPLRITEVKGSFTKYRSAFTSQKSNQDSISTNKEIPRENKNPSEPPRTQEAPEFMIKAADLSGKNLEAYLVLESLGSLPRSFSATQLKICFRKIAKKHHPDRDLQGASIYRMARQAYEILSRMN